MADLSNVTSGDWISSTRQNDINDYIHWGTHWLNTQALRIGGTEVINSSRSINNVASITMSATISEFSTDGTLSANSDSKIPTEKAIRTYIQSMGGSIGGSNTNVQYNDNGVFGGDSSLTWNKTTRLLTVTGFEDLSQTISSTETSSGIIKLNQTAETLMTETHTGVDSTFSQKYKAFKIVPGSNLAVGGFAVNLKKTSTPSNDIIVTGYIYSDNAGVPGTMLKSFSQYHVQAVGGSYTQIRFGTVAPYTLISGTSYWIMLGLSEAFSGLCWRADGLGSNSLADSNDTITWSLSNYNLDVILYGKSLPGIVSTSPQNFALFGTSTTSFGVYGSSVSSYGVIGSSSQNPGVAGTSSYGYGIYGMSSLKSGVYGSSSSSYGVEGYNSDGTKAGVFGYSYGVGVRAENRTASTGSQPVLDLVKAPGYTPGDGEGVQIRFAAKNVSDASDTQLATITGVLTTGTPASTDIKFGARSLGGAVKERVSVNTEGLTLYNFDDAPLAGNVLGSVYFKGLDLASSHITYGQIRGEIVSPAVNAIGRLDFYTLQHGGFLGTTLVLQRGSDSLTEGLVGAGFESYYAPTATGSDNITGLYKGINLDANFTPTLANGSYAAGVNSAFFISHKINANVTGTGTIACPVASLEILQTHTSLEGIIPMFITCSVSGDPSLWGLSAKGEMNFETSNNAIPISISGANMPTAPILNATMSNKTSGDLFDITLDTSTIQSDSYIFNIQDSRNHDNLAGDFYNGFNYIMSGNFPGSLTSLTNLINLRYTGTLGASGSDATLRLINADFSGATLTAGTYAAGRFADTTNTIIFCDGTNAATVTGNILPTVNNAFDLGSDSYRWGNSYTTNTHAYILWLTTGGYISYNDAVTGQSVNISFPNPLNNSYNWVLPQAQGGAGTVLTNDGSGNLSWGAAPGSTYWDRISLWGGNVLTPITRNDSVVLGDDTTAGGSFAVMNSTSDTTAFLVDSSSNYNVIVGTAGYTSNPDFAVYSNSADPAVMPLLYVTPDFGGGVGSVILDSAENTVLGTLTSPGGFFGIFSGTDGDHWGFMVNPPNYDVTIGGINNDFASDLQVYGYISEIKRGINADPARIDLYKFRGDYPAFTQILTSDLLGQLTIYGSNGGIMPFTGAASTIRWQATEDWVADAAYGTRIIFSTCANGESATTDILTLHEKHVGIRTLAPYKDLDVNGDVIIQRSSGTAGAAGLYLGANILPNWCVRIGSGATSRNLFIDNYFTGDDTWYPKIQFSDQTGAVGIGSIPPAEMLDVTGNIQTRSWSNSPGGAGLKIATAAGVHTWSLRLDTTNHLNIDGKNGSFYNYVKINADNGFIGLPAKDTEASSKIEVYGESSMPAATMTMYCNANAQTDAPLIEMLKSKQTVGAVPIAVITDSLLGSLSYGGYDGTGWIHGVVNINTYASENWDADSHGTYMNIKMCDLNSTVVKTKLQLYNHNMHFYNNNFGSTETNLTLHENQASAADHSVNYKATVINSNNNAVEAGSFSVVMDSVSEGNEQSHVEIKALATTAHIGAGTVAEIDCVGRITLQDVSSNPRGYLSLAGVYVLNGDSYVSDGDDLRIFSGNGASGVPSAWGTGKGGDLFIYAGDSYNDSNGGNIEIAAGTHISGGTAGAGGNVIITAGQKGAGGYRAGQVKTYVGEIGENDWVNNITEWTSEAPDIMTNAHKCRQAYYFNNNSEATEGYLNVHYRSRGNYSPTPTAVVNNDKIAEFLFKGHTGMIYNDVAQILVDVDDPLSTGTVPGRMTFKVGDNNSLGTALTINSDAELLVGIKTIYGNAPSANANKIVLDASECVDSVNQTACNYRYARSISSSGYYNTILAHYNTYINITSSAADSGGITLNRLETLRQQATDNGSMDFMLPIDIHYGHYGSVDAAAVTANAFGIQITPYHGAGTITNSRALYIQTPSITGATVTNYHAIYQDDANAKNYLEGDTGIGEVSPAYKLDVDGPIGVESDGSASIYFKGTGYRFRQESYGTGPTKHGLRLAWHSDVSDFRIFEVTCNEDTHTPVDFKFDIDVLPDDNLTYNFGSSSFRWLSGYFGPTLDIDGVAEFSASQIDLYQDIVTHGVNIEMYNAAATPDRKIFLNGISGAATFDGDIVCTDAAFIGVNDKVIYTGISGELMLVGDPTDPSNRFIAARSGAGTASIGLWSHYNGTAGERIHSFIAADSDGTTPLGERGMYIGNLQTVPIGFFVTNVLHAKISSTAFSTHRAINFEMEDNSATPVTVLSVNGSTGDITTAGSYTVGASLLIDASGFIKPVTSADASAPNNSIYYSSDAGKLVYKDSGGSINPLY